METINSASSFSHKENTKGNNINQLCPGITKKLLEKYKPSSDLFTLKTKKNQLKKSIA